LFTDSVDIVAGSPLLEWADFANSFVVGPSLALGARPAFVAGPAGVFTQRRLGLVVGL
jgi:hypothetical protein